LTYLETHPLSTSWQIHAATTLRHVKVLLCLNILDKKGLVDTMPQNLNKYILKYSGTTPSKVIR